MITSFRKAILSMPSSVLPVFAVLCVITFSSLFFLIGFKIELAYFSLDYKCFSRLINDGNNPLFVPVLRYFMALQTIALFGIAPLTIAWVYRKKADSLYLLNKKPTLYFLLLSICFIILVNPFINLLMEFNGNIMDALLGASNSLKDQDLSTQKIVESLLKDTSFSALLINAIVIAFLPAALEELFFRGLLQKVVLSKYMNSHMAILSTAFLFSFIHFQFYGFLPRFVLGVAFGYILLWTGSLWVTICIHFANNFMAVFVQNLISRQLLSESINTVGTNQTSWIGFLSAIVAAFLLWMLFRKYQQSNDYKPT